MEQTNRSSCNITQ